MSQISRFVSIRYPELRWKQRQGKKGAFTLLRNELLAGELNFSLDRKKPSTGICSEGEWSFYWSDWQQFNLLVNQQQGSEAIATYMANDAHNGLVSFANGSDVLLTSGGLLVNRVSLLDEGAQTLALIRPTDMSLANIINVEATVEVTEQGQVLPELPILLLMSWVLILRRGFEC